MIELHIKDSSFAHCEFSNNPMPPKTFSKHIKWVRDERDSVDTVYTDYRVQECNGGIAWLLEPRALIPQIYDYVKNNRSKFREVWSHDHNFIKEVNGTFVPFGGCWIDEEDKKIHRKTKDFSIIASGKRQLRGHMLRHEIITSAQGHIDVFGNGYSPIKDKIEGLKDYRYHFAIENCKTDFWFTEKLIDCLVTGTIPIYWGCPSIFSFFNDSGFIVFDTLVELKEKLKICTPEYYESKMPAIVENFELANNYLLAEDWVFKNVINST